MEIKLFEVPALNTKNVPLLLLSMSTSFQRQTMLARTSGLGRLIRPRRINPSIRYNSSHHHANTHQVPMQGDGSVRTGPFSFNTDNTGLMSPGVFKASIFMGAMYLFYLVDRSVAKKNNGWGILHTWVDKFVDSGTDLDTYYALMESSRQRTKEHYERSQRLIYQQSYPEYVSLLKGMDTDG